VCVFGTICAGADEQRRSLSAGFVRERVLNVATLETKANEKKKNKKKKSNQRKNGQLQEKKRRQEREITYIGERKERGQDIKQCA
jgi:hypothetical protein